MSDGAGVATALRPVATNGSEYDRPVMPPLLGYSLSRLLKNTEDALAVQDMEANHHPRMNGASVM